MKKRGKQSCNTCGERKLEISQIDKRRGMEDGVRIQLS